MRWLDFNKWESLDTATLLLHFLRSPATSHQPLRTWSRPCRALESFIFFSCLEFIRLSFFSRPPIHSVPCRLPFFIISIILRSSSSSSQQQLKVVSCSRVLFFSSLSGGCHWARTIFPQFLPLVHSTLLFSLCLNHFRFFTEFCCCWASKERNTSTTTTTSWGGNKRVSWSEHARESANFPCFRIYYMFTFSEQEQRARDMMWTVSFRMKNEKILSWRKVAVLANSILDVGEYISVYVFRCVIISLNRA